MTRKGNTLSGISNPQLHLARQLRYPPTLDVKVELDVRGRPLRRVICGGPGADGMVARAPCATSK